MYCYWRELNLISLGTVIDYWLSSAEDVLTSAFLKNILLSSSSAYTKLSKCACVSDFLRYPELVSSFPPLCLYSASSVTPDSLRLSCDLGRGFPSGLSSVRRKKVSYYFWDSILRNLLLLFNVGS